MAIELNIFKKIQAKENPPEVIQEKPLTAKEAKQITEQAVKKNIEEEYQEALKNINYWASLGFNYHHYRCNQSSAVLNGVANKLISLGYNVDLPQGVYDNLKISW